MRRLLAATALCVLGACHDAPGNGASDELTVAAPADAYARADDAQLGLYPVNTTIYEPLVRLTPEFGLEPLLATHWEWRAPNTWRFHLRTGVRFHDGTRFTAEAVRWTMERMARRASGSVGIAAHSTMVVDDSTVDITPVFENRRLPEQLAHPNWSIMSPGSDPGTHPVGTGPYRFVRYEPSSHISVQRFDEYWGRRASIARITFRFVPDPATRVLALRAGQTDVVMEFPREVRSDAIVRSPVGGYEALYVNIHGAAPHDLGAEHAVRRAIAHAIDRERIAREVWYGAAEPIATHVPPAILGAFAGLVRGAEHDPARARAILDSAGWRPGADGIRTRQRRRLELVMVVGFPNPIVHKPMPELVQLALRDIGIAMRIEQVPDEAAFQARVRSGTGDLWAEAGGQNDANPCFLTHLLFYSGPRLRVSGWARLFAPGRELDVHVDACRSASTRAAVQQAAAMAERVLVDEQHIVIPLAATRRVWGVAQRVRHFVAHPSSLSQRWEDVQLAAPGRR